MKVDDYYSCNNNILSFTREQASAFAKNMAGDFNPIHDIDARRFCVPGDLLFAALTAELGVHQSMRFVFDSMVNESTQVKLPIDVNAEAGVTLSDQQGKALMRIQRSGEATTNATFINSLIQRYVQFSGQAFPDILVGLMQREGVMINPARPLVIYTSMEIHLDVFELGDMRLNFTGASLEVNGKKGDVVLNFEVLVDGKKVGYGTKNMVLGGLRAYEKETIDALVLDYNQAKVDYLK